jgi:uncharacterized membrane protein HdeD (DUF308 family)
MNTTSRIITGSVMVVLGFGLMIIPFFTGVAGFVSWIYGLPLFIIGIFVLMNENEDKIEERKDLNKVKNKK